MGKQGEEGDPETLYLGTHATKDDAARAYDAEVVRRGLTHCRERSLPPAASTGPTTSATPISMSDVDKWRETNDELDALSPEDRFEAVKKALLVEAQATGTEGYVAPPKPAAAGP